MLSENVQQDINLSLQGKSGAFCCRNWLDLSSFLVHQVKGLNNRPCDKSINNMDDSK